MSDDVKAKLYFECHITIEPIFDEESMRAAKKISNNYGFRIAELLMQKRKEDTPERSMHDTFMTSHSTSLNDIKARMQYCVQDLKYAGFKVWRYKIEDTVMDSKKEDILNLIG